MLFVKRQCILANSFLNWLVVLMDSFVNALFSIYESSWFFLIIISSDNFFLGLLLFMVDLVFCNSTNFFFFFVKYQF